MKYLVAYFCLILFSGSMLAQRVTGKITNQQGEALPYATVYVLGTQQGTASNEDGYYQLDLKRGTYEVRFQYLGYSPQTQRVSIATGNKVLDIQLADEPVDLQAVEVLENKEDPAYTIMRRAIGKASYHLQQLDSYSAISYIKGSGRLKDVPGLFRRRIEKELRKEGIDTSTAFVTESVSEISYVRPNQFKEKVISVRTIGEDNNTSPNSFINSSFYQPEVGTAISPLSPKAFAYYRFEYLGFFADHGLNINKIKVVPRSTGDQLFEGVIYIVDQYWSIHSLDLTTALWGIIFNINQVYQPIQENVWLPVNHIFDVNGSFFGFDFEYKYFANIRDYIVTLNPDLPEDIIVLDEKVEKENVLAADKNYNHRKADESLVALATEKDISRKELRKIMKAYQKEELVDKMSVMKDTAKVDVIETLEYSIDSNAYKRDSIYWMEVRPIPLTLFEQRGYQRLDSLSAVESERAKTGDTLTISMGSGGADFSRNKSGGFAAWDLILGGSYQAGKHVQFGWRSPLESLHFNTVEGYHLSLPFFINRVDEGSRWHVGPTVHYSFARQRLNGSLAISWSDINPKAFGEIKLEMGRVSTQYNPDAIVPLINDLSSLLWERNYMKVFEQTFARVSWDKKINARNVVEVKAELSQRRGLMNRTFHTYFDKDAREYTPNFPFNAELGDTKFDTSGLASVHVLWKTEPWLKYRLRNNKRERIDHSSPIISLGYHAGISGLLEHSAAFQQVDLGFQHFWSFGVRGDLSLKLNAGVFWDQKNMTIIDLHHFPGNRTILTTQNPADSYRLLDYYRFSTQSNYLAIYSHYQFRKLLITRLPIARRKGIREAFFMNILETKSSQHYTELGYGLNYLFRILRVEGVVSFLDGKYQDWGVRIGVASNLEGLFN